MTKTLLSLLLSALLTPSLYGGFVRSAPIGSGTSASRTVTLPATTAGNTLIGCAGWSNTQPATVDASWTPLAEATHQTATVRSKCWMKVAPGGVANFTITFSTSVGNSVHLEEYTALTLTATAASSGVGSALSANLQAQPGETLLAFANNSSAVSWSGMTTRSSNSRSIFAEGTSASLTASGTSAWNLLAFTFVGGGSPPPPPPPSTGQAPPKPELINARAINAHTVEVFWRGSPQAARYNIYRAVPIADDDLQPTAWTTPVLVGTSPQDGVLQVGFMDTDVPAATRYVYLVSAVSADGVESELNTTLHGNVLTPVDGNWIQTWATVWPPAVTLGQPIFVVQVVSCNPACTVGHHDLHRGTNYTDLTLLRGPGSDEWVHSVPDNVPATTRTSTLMWVPPTAGLWYLMEDAHVFGPGFVNNPQGFMPHKEGIIFEVTVQ